MSWMNCVEKSSKNHIIIRIISFRRDDMSYFGPLLEKSVSCNMLKMRKLREGIC